MASSTVAADTLLTVAMVRTEDASPLRRRIFDAFGDLARRPIASGGLLLSARSCK